MPSLQDILPYYCPLVFWAKCYNVAIWPFTIYR